jgi:hypothetical protein
LASSGVRGARAPSDLHSPALPCRGREYFSLSQKLISPVSGRTSRAAAMTATNWGSLRGPWNFSLRHLHHRYPRKSGVQNYLIESAGSSNLDEWPIQNLKHGNRPSRWWAWDCSSALGENRHRPSRPTSTWFVIEPYHQAIDLSMKTFSAVHDSRPITILVGPARCQLAPCGWLGRSG